MSKYKRMTKRAEAEKRLEELRGEKMLDLTRTIDFEVVGDIKPTIIEILGRYETYMGSDCDLHLKGTGISLPAYSKYLTYYSFNIEIDKKIITALYEKGLIKIHEVREY